jgi:hypothetical protein
MQVLINGHSLEISVGIKSFATIVRYKQRYEDSPITLDKYMKQISGGEYNLDAICDLIYYPYATERKGKGLPVKVLWEDVFEWIVSNPSEAEEIGNLLADSLPKPEPIAEEAEAKKKRGRQRKIND